MACRSFFHKRPWLFILALIFSFLILYLAWPYPGDYLTRRYSSIQILDMRGEVLMELTPGHSGYSMPLMLSEYPRQFVDLLLYSEDRNFFIHPGVSLRALGRAWLQNRQEGRVISGGSTITQQLVKSLAGVSRNNLFSKILEIFRAIRLDLHFSKQDILEAYLNTVFLGHRIQGFNQAAWTYFGKYIPALNELEMAALIRLLRAPTALDIYQNTLHLEQAARDLLQRAHAEGVIASERWILSQEDRLEVQPPQSRVTAPHFCLWVLEQARKISRGQPLSRIYTTLDADLYRSVLRIARQRIYSLRDRLASQASVLLLENASGEVRVMLGSVDWDSDDGQINGVTMLRQPGSTMKAFTYALALEKAEYHPASILPDIPTDFPAMVGKYRPSNFDNRFHGPVRLAQALGSSYNIPAVYLLSQVGLREYYAKLRELGFDSLRRGPSFYGLGLTLGNADISLLELTRAYMSLARGGEWLDITAIRSIETADGRTLLPPPATRRQVFLPGTAVLLFDILQDYRYKTPAFGANSPLNLPWPVAVKTGTSKDFRDNTLVGMTGKYTIGLWSGNFSGQAMLDLPSASGTGLIFKDILIEMYNRGDSHDSPYSGQIQRLETVRICSLSGMSAGPGCPAEAMHFLPGTAPVESCSWHTSAGIILPPRYHEWARLNLPAAQLALNEEFQTPLQIIHPRPGDIYQIDPHIPEANQAIRLEALSPEQEPLWFLDGQELGKGRTLMWMLRPGTHELEVRTSQHRASVSFVVVVP